jgi:ABC-type methionine transport system permease subunit
MSSASPISLAARERLRDHQAVTAKAVGGYAAALARLETAAFRRAEVVGRQDVLVAIAVAEVATAIVEAARVMGADVAATVLDLRKTEVHRILKQAQVKEAQ